MLVMPPGAKRISSRMTGFYKRGFPVLWFAFIAGGLIIGFSVPRRAVEMKYQTIFMSLVLGLVGVVIFKVFLSTLMDEVWDNGKELLVINDGHIEHVPLSGILNINYSGFTNPKRATLQLRHPGRWGEKLSFIPPRSTVRLLGLMDNAMIDELVRRVDDARRKV